MTLKTVCESAHRGKQQWNTSNRIQVVAIGLMLGQAEQMAIAELNQQRDVGFANSAANIPVTHECFSLRK